MSVQISNPDARTSVKLSNGASLHLPADQAGNAGPRVSETIKILPAVTSSVSFGILSILPSILATLTSYRPLGLCSTWAS